jgi:DNA-directed RNA polymerase specialized sigma24 family protein
MALPPFQAFFDAHRDEVLGFLTALIGPNDADDCFQETFVAALRAYPRLRPDSNLRAWVLTIARRKAIDTTRARGRRAVPSDDLPEQPVAAAPYDGPPPVWAAVRLLPERQRAAVFLRYAGDLTHRDIASVLDSNEDAVRKNVSDGLKKLKEALHE